MANSCSSFFIAFKSITFDCDKAGGISADEKLGFTTFAALKVASQVVGLAYTFMQSFAGVIHVGLNQHRRKFMRYAGAGAYTLLFANAAKIWTKLAIRKPAALIVEWTNAILGMLAFIFFPLPDVGSKELYQVWSPCVRRSRLLCMLARLGRQTMFRRVKMIRGFARMLLAWCLMRENWCRFGLSG
jgi:hypothetical protein